MEKDVHGRPVLPLSEMTRFFGKFPKLFGILEVVRRYPHSNDTYVTTPSPKRITGKDIGNWPSRIVYCNFGFSIRLASRGGGIDDSRVLHKDVVAIASELAERITIDISKMRKERRSYHWPWIRGNDTTIYTRSGRNVDIRPSHNGYEVMGYSWYESPIFHTTWAVYLSREVGDCPPLGDEWVNVTQPVRVKRPPNKMKPVGKVNMPGHMPGSPGPGPGEDAA